MLPFQSILLRISGLQEARRPGSDFARSTFFEKAGVDGCAHNVAVTSSIPSVVAVALRAGITGTIVEGICLGSNHAGLLTFIKRIGRHCSRIGIQHCAREIMDVFTPVVFYGAAATLCAWRISASCLTLVIVHAICEACWSSLFPCAASEYCIHSSMAVCEHLTTLVDSRFKDEPVTEAQEILHLT